MRPSLSKVLADNLACDVGGGCDFSARVSESPTVSPPPERWNQGPNEARAKRVDDENASRLSSIISTADHREENKEKLRR